MCFSSKSHTDNIKLSSLQLSSFVSFDRAVPVFRGSSKDSSLKTLAQPGGQAPPGVTITPSLNTNKYGGETQQPHPKTTSCLFRGKRAGRLPETTDLGDGDN